MAREQEHITAGDPRQAAPPGSAGVERESGEAGAAEERIGEAVDAARRQAVSLMDSQRQVVARKCERLSSALLETADRLDDDQENTLALYVDRVAEGVERVGKRLEEGDAHSLFDDVQRLARRNPVAYLGGAVALGLIASRFFKVGGRGELEEDEDDDEDRFFDDEELDDEAFELELDPGMSGLDRPAPDVPNVGTGGGSVGTDIPATEAMTSGGWPGVVSERDSVGRLAGRSDRK